MSVKGSSTEHLRQFQPVRLVIVAVVTVMVVT